MRPPSRISRNWWKPWPRAPEQVPAGTAQSENESARVSDAFQPILCSGSEISYPGVPFSITRFEISPSPVSAVIVTHWVISVPAFVMKAFEPLTIQLSPRRSAVVRVAPASEPASGSVRPNAASRSPRASGGIQRCFCSSRAEQEDRHRPERGVCGERDRDRRVDARELLDRDRVGERVAARAAELLGERDAHQPELGHLRDELVGKPALAVELLGDGRDAIDGERAHGVAEELVLGREVEIHARRSYPECVPRRLRATAPRVAG